MVYLSISSILKMAKVMGLSSARLTLLYLSPGHSFAKIHLGIINLLLLKLKSFGILLIGKAVVFLKQLIG